MDLHYESRNPWRLFEYVSLSAERSTAVQYKSLCPRVLTAKWLRGLLSLWPVLTVTILKDSHLDEGKHWIAVGIFPSLSQHTARKVEI